MVCQERNAIMCRKSAKLWDVPVPRRPRSSLLRCKRRLNFDDTSLISKRSRADVVVLDSAKITMAGEGSSAHQCLKTLPSPRTLNNEEQDESKEEEGIHKIVVVGPQTPLPAMRKRVSRGESSLTSKISRSKSNAVIRLENDKLQEVSELAENSLYFTRTINRRVSNAFRLVEGQGASSTSAQLKGLGRRFSLEGKKKPYQKLNRETTGAWRELLQKSFAESCGIKLEKDEGIRMEDGLQFFHEKVHSFLSKVGTIQGQRVYFPWKGSVLDSVIGAFLTQRVGDNFSSSAFMSLGVSFPQYRDCGTYSRHHRMLREKRLEGDRSCQKQNPKGNKLELGAKIRKPFVEKKKDTSRKGMVPRKENIKPDWNILRTQYSGNTEGERSADAIDYVDWHAVRRANVEDISNAIKLRGMNKKLAKRIKEFLDRLMMDHGNLDLEWVRNVPPLQAREFLLSIFGLGMKSAQCVQLLTLKQPAFPVDVNVARVTVRLGWVPAPPNTSDDLQMTVLEENSKLHDFINQYLLPRLCQFDQKTLYELHYHMITFGKVFCTKQKPSCAECPMRKECKHYADVDIEDFGGMDRTKTQKKSMKAKKELLKSRTAKQKALQNDPDYCHKGNVEAPKTPLKDQSLLKMRQKGKKHTKISSTGRQPNRSRTRTQHFVYELHDCHPILEKFDDRDPDDSSPYLLITWNSGDPLANSTPSSSLSHITGAQTVPGTVMIPCRTALKGSFPLNGTYFQINEVFADQQTSRMPIDVRCKTLQQLPRKVLYCGSGLFNIVKESDALLGLSADEVKSLFNEGYICTRGFDRETLAPVTLERRLHTSYQSKKRN